MIRQMLLFPLLAFFCNIAFSQVQSCKCPDNLDTVIHKTEANYAGIPVKVNTQTAAHYKAI